ALAARRAANRWLIFAIGGGALGIALGIVALFIVSQQIIGASALGLLALALFAGTGYSLYNYKRAHNEEQIASKPMQDAISQVGMMVAARETALRMGGNRDAVGKVEHEIRTLGGTVPRSREECQYLLQQVRDNEQPLADIQQRLTKQREASAAALTQVNVTMEAVAALRKECQRLEDQRKNEGWDDRDAQLRSARIAIQDRQNEITTLAGHEGLSIPSFDVAVTESSSTVDDLALAVADAITSSEHEIATLDDKLELVPDLAAQLEMQQEALDILKARKRALTERGQRFQGVNVPEQVERAREQQRTLRSALQNLQDSLRQRVKPLDVSFGQTAINNAEVTARKQLEALHFTLGNRADLQSRHDNYLIVLKDRQDALADHYNRLAKYSGSLGSWIVPPNPFAETLVALRQRCQQEIIDADEQGILRELEQMQVQESASRAKIELCRQEIEEAQERIAIMLVQRHRPASNGTSTMPWTLTDIVAVWPLAGEYTTLDRGRLEEERGAAEQELRGLEQQ
ncbi:MAG TPA: hypothetical protein VIY29_30170, partial [Ktedonobacteraceae bacterium]